MAQEEATMVESIRVASNNALLSKLLITAEEHAARHADIVAKTARPPRFSKEATDEEIKDIIRANDIMEKTREQGLEDFAKQTRHMADQIEREQEQLRTSQLRSYENFINRVAGLLNDIFTQLLDGTLSAIKSSRSSRTIVTISRHQGLRRLWRVLRHRSRRPWAMRCPPALGNV